MSNPHRSQKTTSRLYSLYQAKRYCTVPPMDPPPLGFFYFLFSVFDFTLLRPLSSPYQYL